MSDQFVYLSSLLFSLFLFSPSPFLSPAPISVLNILNPEDQRQRRREEKRRDHGDHEQNRTRIRGENEKKKETRKIEN